MSCETVATGYELCRCLAAVSLEMNSDTESRLRITEGDGFGRIRPDQVADGSGADAKRCLPLPQLEVR